MLPPVMFDLSGTVNGHAERFVPELMHGELVEAEHLGRYWWLSGLASGRRVLDAGCGAGYGSQILHDAGALSVTAVDISPQVIEAVGGRVSSGIALGVADLRDLPFPDDSFDLISCFEVIEHVEDPDPILSELARVLAPGGVLAVSTPNRDASLGTNPHHPNEMTPDEIAAAMARHLPFVRLARQHSWMLTSIFEDDTFRMHGGAPIELDLRKLWAAEPGEESYTIALAGTTRPPMLRNQGALSTGLPFVNILRHIEALQAQLAAAPVAPPPAVAGDVAAAVARLEHMAEQERRRTELEAELAHTRAMLDSVVGSRSWRLLAPVRLAASAARRLLRRL